MRRQFAIVAIVGLCLVSCAKYSKQEFFVAYDQNGNAQYYRVSMSGLAQTGEAHYSSGWYDQRAVDGLFGDLAARQTVEASLAKEHKQVISDTFSTYLNALKENKSADEIEQRRKNYIAALEAVTGSAPLGTDREGSLDYSDKKLVFILSNDPSRIIAAIKDKLDNNQLRETISKKLKQERANDKEKTKRRLAALTADLDVAGAALKDGDTALGESTANVKAILEGLVSRVEASK